MLCQAGRPSQTPLCANAPFTSSETSEPQITAEKAEVCGVFQSGSAASQCGGSCGLVLFGYVTPFGNNMSKGGIF